MKIAIFGDVHGNIIALENFLNFVSEKVDGYVCTGDIVNYGPWSDECVQVIKKLPNLVCVRGNHEDILLNEIEIPENSLVDDFTKKTKEFFTEYDWIKSLPRDNYFQKFYVTHTLEDKYIYENTTVSVTQDTIIGHSHQQYIRNVKKSLLINPGSIGQNRDFIDLIQFFCLDTENETIEQFTLQYNVDLLLNEMKSRNFSTQCIEYYSQKPRLN